MHISQTHLKPFHHHDQQALSWKQRVQTIEMASSMAPWLLLFLLQGSFVFSTAVPLNLLEILGRGGQYTTFLRYLTMTDAGRQMNSYVSRGSNLTVFAPTDNAFGKLESGFFEQFSPREKMEFLLIHFVPQFYTWQNFPTAGLNVMSMAGGNYTLDFHASGGQQVSISTGLVTVPVNHQLNLTFPVAVYSIDTVLKHSQLFDAPSESSEPPASPSTPPPSSPSQPSTTLASESPSGPSPTPPSMSPASSPPPSPTPPSMPPASSQPPSLTPPSMPPSSPSEPPTKSNTTSSPPSLPPSSASSVPPSLPPPIASEPTEPPATSSPPPRIPTVPETAPPSVEADPPAASGDSGSFQVKATWWSSLLVLLLAYLV